MSPGLGSGRRAGEGTKRLLYRLRSASFLGGELNLPPGEQESRNRLSKLQRVCVCVLHTRGAV